MKKIVVGFALLAVSVSFNMQGMQIMDWQDMARMQGMQQAATPLQLMERARLAKKAVNIRQKAQEMQLDAVEKQLQLGAIALQEARQTAAEQQELADEVIQFTQELARAQAQGTISVRPVAYRP